MGVPMHDMQKQLIVEIRFRRMIELYRLTAYAAGCNTACRLVCICKGIGRAGRYYPHTRMIEINTAYFDGIDCENLDITIAHELAHHITAVLYPKASQWHGVEFRAVMQSIGYRGDTYHSMKRKDAVVVASRSKGELFEI